MTQGLDAGVSIVRRWQLAATLKALREQAELTQEEAIERLQQGQGKWSRSKMSRIENREQGLKPRDIEQLLDAYRVTDVATRDGLLQLALGSNEQGWWVRYLGVLPKEAPPLLGIEGGLVGLRDFQSQLVHGLLQTPDYTRALINVINPGVFAPEDMADLIAARMVRQQIIDHDEPPNLHFIIDQTVLERVVGEPPVMYGQLRRLLELAKKPSITMQVLPKNIGGSPGLEGPFAVLTLPEPIPDVGHVEGPAGTLYIEDRDRVRLLTLRFGILTQQALSREASVEMISEAMRSYD
ncbi:MAG TPA: helix-turn-helix transcriptional regulator [Pseudonocardiaceae bacterium]|nr:helix-turn-helix transcriptional regulator [Pseudonocardiaceae bacterium]